jgi:hypothetical protein
MVVMGDIGDGASEVLQESERSRWMPEMVVGELLPVSPANACVGHVGCHWQSVESVERLVSGHGWSRCTLAAVQWLCHGGVAPPAPLQCVL